MEHQQKNTDSEMVAVICYHGREERYGFQLCIFHEPVQIWAF